MPVRTRRRTYGRHNRSTTPPLAGSASTPGNGDGNDSYDDSIASAPVYKRAKLEEKSERPEAPVSISASDEAVSDAALDEGQASGSSEQLAANVAGDHRAATFKDIVVVEKGTAGDTAGPSSPSPRSPSHPPLASSPLRHPSLQPPPSSYYSRDTSPTQPLNSSQLRDEGVSWEGDDDDDMWNQDTTWVPDEGAKPRGEPWHPLPAIGSTGNHGYAVQEQEIVVPPDTGWRRWSEPQPSEPPRSTSSASRFPRQLPASPEKLLDSSDEDSQIPPSYRYGDDSPAPNSTSDPGLPDEIHVVSSQPQPILKDLEGQLLDADTTVITLISESPRIVISRDIPLPLIAPSDTAAPVSEYRPLPDLHQREHHPAAGPLVILPRSPVARIPSPSPTSSPVPPLSPARSAAVAALDKFRTARTFRTRTALQLQPYTKEKQDYTRALRRGGLKKSKRTVARDVGVSEEEDQEEEEVEVEASQSSEGEEDTLPEAIVIGNTPPPPKRRRERSVRPTEDGDFDEYFLKYGEVADEEDDTAKERLQKIVRERWKREKEDDRKSREAARRDRAFERLILMREHAREELDTLEEPNPKSSKRARKLNSHTPGKKTYGKKSQARHLLQRLSGESDNVPDLPPRLPPPRVDLFGSPDSDSLPDLPPPLPPRQDVLLSPTFDAAVSPLLQERSSPNVEFYGEESFFVNDIPQHTTRHREDSTDVDSSSDEDSRRKDPREKAARRMLPGALLKRLEQAAAAREANKTGRERKKGRKAVESPLKPGKAVIRKGKTVVDVNDVVNLLGDSEESDHLPPRDSGGRKSPLRDRTLIIVSDDSGTDSSEAMEDNRGGESLARLYRGEFEDIIAGKRVKSRFKAKAYTQPKATVKSTRKHTRRPPLGLVKKKRLPSSPTTKLLQQSRLDFPVQDESPAGRAKKKSSVKAKPARRPAIQLNDEVIFATADFAFESEDGLDIPLRQSASRSFSRTKSKSVAELEDLDAGIGKARSWANFDKFPIDFDINPLPSGVYCGSTTIAGSGVLANLVTEIQGGAVDLKQEACFAYDLELIPGMNLSAVSAVIPIIFEGLQHSITSFVNKGATGPPSVVALEFLGRYLSSLVCDREDFDDFSTVLRSSIVAVSDNLDEMWLTSGKRDRLAQEALLKVRWSFLELSFKLGMKIGFQTDSASELVKESSTRLIRQLLAYGFDHTVRPLKLILKGEAESPEVLDSTVALWAALIHASSAWDEQRNLDPNSTFLLALDSALDVNLRLDQVGPMAAERIWFLIFGLCAISQFGVDGKISPEFTPSPRWSLVRRATALIKVSHSQEAEENAHLDQLQGRDRYLKVMVARCVRLSSIWKWHFDRESFSITSKNLGVIFKDRQHRNLPTEPPVDFPDFVTHFDISLTATEDTKEESAFEMYLRLACVAASDLISSTDTLLEAQQAEKDVQRLIMSIFPFSPVNFSKTSPPSPKQLGALVNRYSTMIMACYFSPSLLGWVLANSRKWLAFEMADLESRQICIRGLMYLAVAVRHHGQCLKPVVDKLADILGILQKELDDCPASGSRFDIERTMVLVVTCFRQIILHHAYDLHRQAEPVYPDPCLLHSSWTSRIFSLDLAKDRQSGLEIVGTIQAFLDCRAAALPLKAKRARESKIVESQSQDDYPSLGFDFDAVDLRELGGVEDKQPVQEDPIEKMDLEFANLVLTVICPNIYRLLSDMLPSTSEARDFKAEKQIFISRLTKCWSDCAGVVVVEHQLLDWSSYIGSFGSQSFSRFGDELGRIQVGLHFMLNVSKLDPGSFKKYEEEYISLMFQTVVTDKITVEHKYMSAIFNMPGGMDHLLFQGLAEMSFSVKDLDRGAFMQHRSAILDVIFGNIPNLLRSKWTPTSMKPFIYRCINLLVSSLLLNENSIDPEKAIHKTSYHAFAITTIQNVRRLAGEFVTPSSVPGLKAFGNTGS
ncbi:hypothetical protein P7C73_g409, partial [Tremellales sp. Uapishka_1]